MSTEQSYEPVARKSTRIEPSAPHRNTSDVRINGNHNNVIVQSPDTIIGSLYEQQVGLLERIVALLTEVNARLTSQLPQQGNRN